MNSESMPQQHSPARFPGGKVAYKALLERMPLEGARVLHFGCGRDLNRVRSSLAGADLVVGVDVDMEALRDYGGPGWLLTSHSLPFVDGAFDFVVSEYVLEHLEDPASVFAEIFRVLRGGGVFIALAPNAWSYKSVAARLIPNWLHAPLVGWLRPETRRKAVDVYPTYFRANSRKALASEFRACGGEMTRLTYVNNGPTWFRRIPGLFEFGLGIHWLMDRLPLLERCKCNLLVEGRKKGAAPRSASLVSCPSCGADLHAEHGSKAITCSCSGGFDLLDGVYVAR